MPPAGGIGANRPDRQPKPIHDLNDLLHWLTSRQGKGELQLIRGVIADQLLNRAFLRTIQPTLRPLILSPLLDLQAGSAFRLIFLPPFPSRMVVDAKNRANVPVGFSSIPKTDALLA